MITQLVHASAVEIAQRRAGRIGAGVYAGRPTSLILRNLYALRTNNGLVFFSGFVEPVFYLLAFGFGLGDFIGTVTGPGNQQLDYATYIAPALLATSAMNGAIYDSTWNVFFKMRYAKYYQAVMSTSLGALDAAAGEIAWAMIRGASYGFGFMCIVTPLGLVPSWWGVLAIPSAALIALGFASAGMAITSYLDSHQQMNWVNFVMLPMFLFSGAFFPITGYPEFAQYLIQALPLWQGIEIIRGFMSGTLTLALVGHVLYFVAFSVIGISITTRRLNWLFLR